MKRAHFFFKTLRNRIEKAVLVAIEEKKPTLLTRTLYLLSLLFSFGLFTNRALQKVKEKSLKRYSFPVVCIGNITVGGTGKTPFVQMLARDLQNKLKIALVTTGYKASGVTKHEVLKPLDCRGRLVSGWYCGDEAALLQRSLKNVEVFVCKKRKRSLEKAEERRCDLVFLDDGLHDSSIHKDISIVMMQGKDPLGKGYYLPRGYLRDSPKRLKKADLVCLNYDYFEVPDRAKALKVIRPYTQAHVMLTRSTPKRIRGDVEWEIGGLKGKKAAVFCGIARPQAFMKTIKCLGVEICENWVFSDHDGPSQLKFIQMYEKALSVGADLMLCTEKDYVKVSSYKRGKLPLAYLEMRLEILQGERYYQDLKKTLLSRIETARH